MMLARVCRGTLVPQTQTLFKLPSVAKPQFTNIQTVRLFANDGRSTYTRSFRARQTIKEHVAAPAGETAWKLGQGAVAGGAALGIGALCFYGLGLSSDLGTIDKAGMWPQYVKDRIRVTYMYLGGSVVATATSAVLCLRSPAVMKLVMNQRWLTIVGSLVAMIGSGMVAQMIPYEEGFGAKQIAWLVHSGIMGAVVAPVCLLGGALVMRAAWYTAGVVGGLSAVAVCAPSDKFLNIGGPLAIGFGVVFCSSLGSMFLPPTTAVGAGLHSMALYGGLILFSMFLLYDTQKMIKRAEKQPHYGYGAPATFDPINNAMSIYIDVMNIFIRIVSIVSGGSRRN